MKYKQLKNILDKIFALGLLPFSALVIFPVTLISFLRYFENPFFLQKRLGENEREFTIYKLKTFFKGKPTKWGLFLRKYSLDELPQVLNVLKGEMSFIGPRPLPPEYLSVYTPKERIRHQVKPGITGLAQVKGRNRLSWKNKFRYDVFYVQKLSYKLDLYILGQTLRVWLRQEGIDANSEITGAENLLKVRKREKEI